MAFLKLFKNAYTFKAARFKEEDIDPVNPDRGWFHLYTFNVSSEKTEPGLETVVTDPKQPIVLILIGIGKKVTSETSEKIKEIIDHFSAEGKDIVLRIAYDTNGHALEKEPEYIEDVLECAEKIGKLVSDLGDKIFVYQGLLVGAWGEMHTTRYDDLESLRMIYEKLMASDPGCYYTVRRPDIHRYLTEKGDRLGLFNDALFASEDELGTFADPKSDSEYVSNVSLTVPYGGETVLGNGYIKTLSDKEIIERFEKKRITYLNSDHDLKLLDHLKANDELYGYIQKHLGYRLHVSGVSFSQGTKMFCVRVVNSGFAPVYRSTKSTLCYTDSEGYVFEQETELDLSKSLELKILIPEKIFNGFKMPVRVSLKTVRRYDGREIHFVNTPCEEGGVYLGELF
ncbi:MAG: DUF4832 domain-containing protein [Lachnospiraceae bacterium]|nr:DUF4832 domain-containing protein [Lachnospiraceae bacterium]